MRFRRSSRGRVRSRQRHRGRGRRHGKTLRSYGSPRGGVRL